MRPEPRWGLSGGLFKLKCFLSFFLMVSMFFYYSLFCFLFSITKCYLTVVYFRDIYFTYKTRHVYFHVGSWLNKFIIIYLINKRKNYFYYSTTASLHTGPPSCYLPPGCFLGITWLYWVILCLGIGAVCLLLFYNFLWCDDLIVVLFFTVLCNENIFLFFFFLFSYSYSS